jgi:hypothetical protein
MRSRNQGNESLLKRKNLRSKNNVDAGTMQKKETYTPFLSSAIWPIQTTWLTRRLVPRI